MNNHALEQVLTSETPCICRLDIFLFALIEKQGKGIGCNGSSLPLFSIPSLL